MNKKELLVCVLAKYPVSGNVKTRLASTIGDEYAVDLYKELLLNTVREVQRAEISKHVLVASTDIKYKDELVLLLRNEADVVFLTEKSLSSLIFRIFYEYLNKQQYKKVMVMCSDSPFIDAKLIEEAGKGLENPRTVFISPSSDGGYSLIGMNTFVDLFSNVTMSRNDVFENTVSLAKKSGFNVQVSRVIDDIDTVDDLLTSYDKLKHSPNSSDKIKAQLRGIIEEYPAGR